MKEIGTTFGFTNGIITILSLLSGLYATKVQKVGVIGAILALLITDPLSDAYSMYKSQKSQKDAIEIGKKAFYSQMSIQFIFLCIIIISPSLYQGLLYCYGIGIILVILYDRYKKESIQSTFYNIGSIIFLVVLTLIIDTFVYKFFS